MRAPYLEPGLREPKARLAAVRSAVEELAKFVGASRISGPGL